MVKMRQKKNDQKECPKEVSVLQATRQEKACTLTANAVLVEICEIFTSENDSSHAVHAARKRPHAIHISRLKPHIEGDAGLPKEQYVRDSKIVIRGSLE